MFGFNMTRACTVAARARYPEMRGVLPVGRVQTPTLGLVVNRWLAVKNHQEAWYFTVDAAFSGAEHAIEARMQVPEDAPAMKKRISDEGWSNPLRAVTDKTACRGGKRQDRHRGK